MNSLENWYKNNKFVLNYLFERLINISNRYDYKLIDSMDTFNNFIYMMYQESNKEVINKQLYSEYFPSKLHSNGYQDYLIIE